MNRWIIGLILGVALITVPAFLLKEGIYGWTLFLLVPMALGAVGAWVARAQTGWGAAGAGAVAVIAASFSLLALGVEGLFCILMCVPLVGPLGAVGGYLWYVWPGRQKARGAATLLLILPAGTLGFDVTAQPTTYEVHTTIDIAAPPENVWPHVVAFREIAEPGEWYFRKGLAYPKLTRIEGSGPGVARYCELSTGPVEETIEVWDEPRMLRFAVTKSPPPMREWSPFGDIQPKHLNGYFRSKRGQFLLTRLPNGGTHVEGTSWYQHGLWPAQYWRLWSDAIVRRIHLRVLEHIKQLSE
jgi:hypothetical protein